MFSSPGRLISSRSLDIAFSSFSCLISSRYSHASSPRVLISIVRYRTEKTDHERAKREGNLEGILNEEGNSRVLEFFFATECTSSLKGREETASSAAWSYLERVARMSVGAGFVR